MDVTVGSDNIYELYAVASTAGAYAITISSPTTTVVDASAMGIGIAGLNTASPFDVTPSSIATSGQVGTTAPSVSVPLVAGTSNPNDLLLGLVGFYGGGAATISPGVSFTAVHATATSTDSNAWQEYQQLSSITGPVTVSATLTTAEPWNIIAEALKPVQAVTLSPTSGPVSSSVTATGSGFTGNGQTVTVDFAGSPVTCAGAPIAVSSGSFTCQFNVPDSAAGTYAVTASTTSDGTIVATQSFIVAALPSTDASAVLTCTLAAGAGSCSGALATTGTSDVLVVLLTLTAVTPGTPPAVTLPSYASLTFTARQSAVAVEVAGDAYLWEWYATTTVAHASGTLSVTVNSGASGGSGVAVAVLGANTQNPFNPASPATIAKGTGTAVTGPSVSTTISNDLVLGLVSTLASSTFTQGAGFTTIAGGAASFAYAESQGAVTTGSYQTLATLGGSTDWAADTAPIAPDPTLALSSNGPSTLPTSGLTASGTGFDPSSTVSFTVVGGGSVTGTCTVLAGGGFTGCAITIATAPTGLQTIKATDTLSNTATATYTVDPSWSFTPTSHTLPATLTATGTGFVASHAITFAATNPASISFSAGSCTTDTSGSFSCTITVTSSSSTSQTLTAADGTNTVTSTSSFTPTALLTFTPSSGNVGSSVTLSGTGFRAGEAVTPYFGGTAESCVPAVTVAPDGTFTCTMTVPSGTPRGSYSIAASTTSDGTVAAVSTFTVTPSITVSPGQGPQGASVTVAGKGFSSSTTLSSLTFDGVLISTCLSGSLSPDATGVFSCTFAVPAGTSGTTVTAVDASGPTATGSFTVTVLHITVSPTSGPVGASVTVSGTGFSVSKATNPTLVFDGVTIASASCTSGSLSTDATGAFSCTFLVPSGTSGTTVTATDVGGQAATGAFSVSTPTITVTPNTGPEGTQVTVAGSGFSTSSSVTLNFDGVSQATCTSGSLSTSASGTFSCAFSVPSGTSTSTVTATDSGGATATGTFTVTTPTVALTPTQGPVGASYTVTASGFTANSNARVSFGGTYQAPTGCTIGHSAGTTITTSGAGDFTCVFTVPSGTPGVYYVVGTDLASGTATTAEPFKITTPTIVLSPTQGPSGVTVTATGSGFSPTTDTGGAITVTFGGGGATLASFSPATCTVSSTPGSLGTFSCSFTVSGSSATYTITATGSDGSFDAATAPYTITTPVLALVPTQGPSGATVTASGTGFTTLTTIAFTGATIGSPSACSTSATGSFSGCTFTISGAAAPYTVRAYGADVGTVPADTATKTFVITTPTLTLSPTQGPSGSTVTASGTGFTPGATITTTIGAGATITNCGATVSGTGTFSCSVKITGTASGTPYTVTATGSDGSFDAAPALFTITLPSITLSLSQGPAGAAYKVTATGFSVSSDANLLFNGIAQTPSSTCTVGSSSGTTITTDASGAFACVFAAPNPSPAGTYYVVGSDIASGTQTTAVAFTLTTPALTLSPIQGPSGITVTATGSGFTPTTASGGAITVTFGAGAATLASFSPLTCTVSSAPGSLGTFSCSFTVSGSAATYTITATGSDGSFDAATAPYTITTPVLTLSPTQGPSGATVTASGTGFTTLTTITFTITIGGTIGSPSACSTSATGSFSGCTFTISGAAAPYTVRASGADVGTVPADSATKPFTITTPTIVVNPTQGPVGATYTVTATGFSVTSPVTVAFAGVDQTPSTCGPGSPVGTAITTSNSGGFVCSFIVPTGKATGPYTIVATDGSTLDASNSVIFTVTKPTIRLDPAQNPVGADYTVTGVGFSVSSQATVTFNAQTQTPLSCSVGAIYSGTIITTDSSGGFACSFQVPGFSSAIYQVYGTDRATSTLTTLEPFTITVPTISIAPTQGPVGAVYTVTATGFTVGGSATVSFGVLGPQTPSATCTIGTGGTGSSTITAADNTTVTPGRFTCTFTVPSVSAGPYTVEGKDLTTLAVYDRTFTVTAPVITLNPTYGFVGSTVSVFGTGFSVSTPLTSLTFGSNTIATCTSGSETTNATGTFVCSFLVLASPTLSTTVTATDVGGQFATASFVVLYPMAFHETGLTGEAWSVTVTGPAGGNFTGSATPSGTRSVLEVSVPAGTFAYTIHDVSGWHISSGAAYSASGIVVASPGVTFSMTFSQVVYLVQWTATGLTGETWGLTVNGTHQTLVGNGVISFSLPNGTLTYSIQDVSGWHQYSIAYSGTIVGAVNGGTGSIAYVTGTSVGYAKTLSFFQVLYRVTFTASGFGAGTEHWGITVNGTHAGRAGDGTLTFTLPNGTITYSLDDVSGWHQYTIPYSATLVNVVIGGTGPINGTGPGYATAFTFTQVTYAIEFSVTGLNGAETWTITVNATQVNEQVLVGHGDGSLTAQLPNGTWTYTLNDVSGWHTTFPYSGGSGTLGAVSGGTHAIGAAPVTPSTPITITFTQVTYGITFVIHGLVGSPAWTITVNGTQVLSGSGNGQGTAQLPNGTWTYTITDVPGWHTHFPYSGGSATNGSVNGGTHAIDGSYTWLTAVVNFYPVINAVRFGQSTLPSWESWFVNATSGTGECAYLGASCSATGGTATLTLYLANGTYSLTIQSGGLFYAPNPGPDSAFVVSGPPEGTLPVTFTAMVTTVSFAAPTTLPGWVGHWFVNVTAQNGSTFEHEGTYNGPISFSAFNGSYTFTLNSWTSLYGPSPGGGRISVTGVGTGGVSVTVTGNSPAQNLATTPSTWTAEITTVTFAPPTTLPAWVGSWFVNETTSNGSTFEHSGAYNGAVRFSAFNGSYTFTLNSWRSYYGPSPASGVFVVSGVTSPGLGTVYVSGGLANVPALFTAMTYTLVLTPSGLGSWTQVWFVNLTAVNGTHLNGGQPFSAAYNTAITVNVFNGTHWIANSWQSYYGPSPAQGTVSGILTPTPIPITIVFTAEVDHVTLTPSGLGAWTNAWFVNVTAVNGTHLNGGAPFTAAYDVPISFDAFNGTTWQVNSWELVYGPSPATGSVAGIVRPGTIGEVIVFTAETTTVSFAAPTTLPGWVGSWYVNATTANLTMFEHRGVFDGTITFLAFNGTYTFSVNSWNSYYAPSPGRGTITVSGVTTPGAGTVTVIGSGSVNLAITPPVFTAMIDTVVLTPSGLGAWTGTWFVNLTAANGTHLNSGIPLQAAYNVPIVFSAFNGTTWVANSWRQYYAPSPGEGTLSGITSPGGFGVVIEFTGETTAVSFTPLLDPVTADSYFVNLTAQNGTSLPSLFVGSLATSLTIHLFNGTYHYSVSTGGSFYQPAPATGSISVTFGTPITNVLGATSFTLLTQTVLFTETGLSSGESWFVNATSGGVQCELPGVSCDVSGTTAALRLTVPNGTYVFTIASGGNRFDAHPPIGSVTVDGAGSTQGVLFTPVPQVIYSQVNATAAQIQPWGLPQAQEFTAGGSSVQASFIVVYLAGTGTAEVSLGTTLWGHNTLANTTIAVSGAGWYKVGFPGVMLWGGTDYYLNVYGSPGVTWGFTIVPTVAIGNLQEYYYDGGVLSSGTSTPDIYAIGGFDPTVYYAVTFTETGLSGGTWSVTLGADTLSASAGAPIVFPETNGIYSYTVGAVAGYTAAPSSGSVTVSGAATGAAIVFTSSLAPTYSVTFTETGVSSGTWSVTLGASTLTAAALSPIVFTEPDGNYAYTVATLTGYTAAPASGSIAVSGSNTGQAIVFTPVPTYSVTFTETGLSSGSWSVTLGASTLSAAALSPIVFTESNGAYGFTVASVAGYTVSPASGPIVVSGAGVGQAIVFTAIPTYSVTFTETGLSSGSWSVTLGASTLSAAALSPIVFTEPNGAYGFTVGSVIGYAPVPSTGTVTVSGAAVGQGISFIAALPSVYSQVNATVAHISPYGLPGAEAFTVGGSSATVNFVVVYLAGSGIAEVSLGSTLWGHTVLSNVSVPVSGAGWYKITFPAIVLTGSTTYYLNVYGPSTVSWGYTVAPSVAQNDLQDYYYVGATLFHDDLSPNVYTVGYATVPPPSHAGPTVAALFSSGANGSAAPSFAGGLPVAAASSKGAAAA